MNMNQRRVWLLIGVVAVFASGVWCGRATTGHVEAVGAAAAAVTQDNQVFEMRTYTTHDGKLADLNARFRTHTTKLFAKHGMKNIGYWTPRDSPLSPTTLIYIVAHESPEAAKASWAAFRNDPDWQKASKASEADGKIVAKLDSVYLDPTDYSPLK